jgi:hypothetical protein
VSFLIVLSHSSAVAQLLSVRRLRATHNFMDKIKTAKSKFKEAARYANGDDVYGVNLLAEGLLALAEAIEELQPPKRRTRVKRPK